MILSDRDIHNALALGRARISPMDVRQVQPASVDLRLGNDWVWCGPDGPEKRHGELVLEPGDCVLGTTLERVYVDASLAARVEGKSSWGRRFLLVHATAGWIDPGFEGQITLEFANLSRQRLVIVPGTFICQLTFLTMTSPAARPYGSEGLNSKYQGQVGTTPARNAL